MNGKGHKKKWDSKVLSISTMNDKYKICFEEKKKKETQPINAFVPHISLPSFSYQPFLSKDQPF